jgi:dihydrofolate reductase
MRKLLVLNHLTLDGVLQAPARPDEDRRGGFEHGGWAVGTADPVMVQTISQGMSTVLLLGRRTYEDFYSVWPARTDNPFSTMLDNSQKYVVSRSLREPLAWKNSTLLSGEAAESVARLKQEAGNDLLVMGSGELLQTLMRHRLIDEYLLMIHPLVLGQGRRLFREDAGLSKLTLVNSVTTTKGVLIATYRPVAQTAATNEETRHGTVTA